MHYDRKVLYILTGLFTGLLLLACFVPKPAYGNLFLALFGILFAAAFLLFVKKRSILAVVHKQVALLALAAALMAIALFYVTGLRFGYAKSSFAAHLRWMDLIAYLVAIPSAEAIRRILLAQKGKVIHALSYLALVILEILLFMSNRPLGSFSRFMDFCGTVLIPAITANILYHYLSVRYGALPNIAFRIPLALYPLLFPVVSNMPAALYSFCKTVLPLLVLLFIRGLYEQKKNAASRRSRITDAIVTTISVGIMAVFILLISCQFRFGLLVIATESMTGTLDQGDALIYKQYTNQTIKPGEILVFRSNEKRVIHRVTHLENINGELRIYTKGDANDAPDPGYITPNDIIGIQHWKIKFLGYPTLWMRELFNK